MLLQNVVSVEALTTSVAFVWPKLTEKEKRVRFRLHGKSDNKSNYRTQSLNPDAVCPVQFKPLNSFQYLLDGVVSSKVVHHVALGTEGLATVLGARERPVVVVDTHMHG